MRHATSTSSLPRLHMAPLSSSPGASVPLVFRFLHLQDRQYLFGSVSPPFSRPWELNQMDSWTAYVSVWETWYKTKQTNKPTACFLGQESLCLRGSNSKSKIRYLPDTQWHLTGVLVTFMCQLGWAIQYLVIQSTLGVSVKKVCCNCCNRLPSADIKESPVHYPLESGCTWSNQLKVLRTEWRFPQRKRHPAWELKCPFLPESFQPTFRALSCNWKIIFFKK